MLGYADYVFTGTFAFEIVLKVTGITGVCFRGLLLCVTHGQDTWCAFGYFQFLSSVINLHFFFFKTKGFFSYNHSTFCCYFFKKTLECMWELFWLPNSDWELYFASFFFNILWNLSTDNRSNAVCELSSTLPVLEVRGKAFLRGRKRLSCFFDCIMFLVPWNSNTLFSCNKICKITWVSLC